MYDVHPLDHYEIHGGRPLRGRVTISGAKNAALPMMAAALLTGRPAELRRVPDIVDVRVMIEILRAVGAMVETDEPGTLRVDARDAQPMAAPAGMVQALRASFLLMGAMLARFGRASCAPPGGDVVGQRPLDVHLHGFAALGAAVEREGDHFIARAPAGLRGARIFLDYPSVLGTENLLIAASLARGTTVLVNAAAEPEVAALAGMLNAMGARIRGAGTHTIEIVGVSELGGVAAEVIADRIEAGTYAIAGVLGGGPITVEGVEPLHMDALLFKLGEAGAHVERGGDWVTVASGERLSAVSVQALPYPGLATDLQAQVAVLLTQAEGVSLVHERVFDNRMLYISELRSLGAEVVSTGSTAIIRGPTHLTGASVRALDLRAGAALILAGLVAQGVTALHDIYHLDRGYERLEQKLQGLGADVRRVRND